MSWQFSCNVCLYKYLVLNYNIAISNKVTHFLHSSTIIQEIKLLIHIMACTVKEIMGRHSTLEAFRCDYFKGSSQSHVKRRRPSHRHKNVSMLPTFSELKTAVQQSAPLEPFAKEGSKIGMDPLTLTITGTVTFKNSMAIDEEIMATMLQHFDTLNNTIHESGIVMQLVSNEIDPSKHYNLF